MPEPVRRDAPPANESEAQRVNRALAEAAEAAAARQADETSPGGRFLVEGAWVDAEGKPVPRRQE